MKCRRSDYYEPSTYNDFYAHCWRLLLARHFSEYETKILVAKTRNLLRQVQARLQSSVVYARFMLPLFWAYGFQYNIFVGLVAGVNCGLHFAVDDLKANKKKINLWQDQLIHIVQIVITALLVPFLYLLWEKLNFFRKSCGKSLTNPKKYAIIVVSNG